MSSIRLMTRPSCVVPTHHFTLGTALIDPPNMRDLRKELNRPLH